MNRRLRFALFALAAGSWLVATPMAQFETPNRQFHNKTSFRLEGRHQATPCESCHINGVFKGTPTTCMGCHWVRRQDDRFKLQLGSQCEQCHTPAGWTPARFDHGAFTGTPLNGAHRLLSCQQCHKNDNFRTADSACVNCHLQDYQSAREPNHAASGFPTTCETCHRASDRSFDQAIFDHQASFPLVGQHASQTCAACHKNNVYRGTTRDCVGCHRTAYDRTTTPPHAAAGFPTTCDSCHRATDSSFRGATFNHTTVFPLVGRHAQTTCVTCHKNNVYRGTARDCVGCHRTEYDRTTTPPHAAAGFPTTCDSCHRATDSSFRGATFNHTTVFPLVGQHAQQTCVACHVNNVYRGTARECVGCHRAAYDRTTTPPHAAAGFPTTCDSCHRATDSSFRGATFNHTNVFALVGRHAQLSCATCHVNNVYRGTARECVGCHRAQYDRTTTPPHASSGFSTNCETCHRATDSSFRGATFNHAASFALLGRHAQISCVSCHVNNVYRGTARECVGCHRSQYDRTTSPSHTAAGFPVTCESCHRGSDSAWTQGTFTHRFPIASGRHKAPCATCHTNPSTFQTFSCLTCHEHSKSEMDKEHQGRAGYRYDSLACYGCHPNGR